MKPETIKKNYPKYKEIFEISLTGNRKEKMLVCEKYNITMSTFYKYRDHYLTYCATPKEREFYEQRKKEGNIEFLASQAKTHAEGQRLAYLTSLNLSYRTLMKVMTLVKPTKREAVELKNIKREQYKQEKQIDETTINAIIDAIMTGIEDELSPGKKRKMHPLDLYIKFETTSNVLNNYCSNSRNKDQLLCLIQFFEKNKEKFTTKKSFQKLIDETEFAFSVDGDFCTKEEKEQYKNYMIKHKIPKNLSMFNEVGKRVQQGYIQIEEPTKKKTK